MRKRLEKGKRAHLCVLLFFLCFPKVIFAQTVDQKDLMRKYWNMRENLRKYYIQYHQRNGGGIPADHRQYPFLHGVPSSPPFSNDRIDKLFPNSIDWGADGTTRIGDYLIVLSTEYYLLQDNKLENAPAIQETLNELYYVINAVDRLDKNANLYLSNGSAAIKKVPDGYTLRDDIPDEEVINYIHEQVKPIWAEIQKRRAESALRRQKL